MTVGGSDSSWSEPLASAPALRVIDQLTSGRQSRAAQTWLAADSEIAMVVHAGCDMVKRAHRAIFDAAGSSGLYDPQSDDPDSAYWKHAGGLDLEAQQWFTIAAGIQSCVANFELYLEEISLQCLTSQIGDRKKTTPAWTILTAAWKKAGVDLESAPFKHARDLRHQVAHRLDEDRVSRPSPARRPWPHFTTDAVGEYGGHDNAGTVVLTPQRFEDEVRQPIAAKVLEIEQTFRQSS